MCYLAFSFVLFIYAIQATSNSIFKIKSPLPAPSSRMITGFNTITNRFFFLGGKKSAIDDLNKQLWEFDPISEKFTFVDFNFLQILIDGKFFPISLGTVSESFATFDNVIYIWYLPIVGSPSHPNNFILQFDMKTKLLTIFNDKAITNTQGIDNPCVTQSNGVLYIIGGDDINKGAIGGTIAIDIHSKSIFLNPNNIFLKEPRFSSSCQAHKNTLFIFGGKANNIALDSIEINYIDHSSAPLQNQWNKLNTRLSVARFNAKSVVLDHDNFIAIIGGYDPYTADETNIIDIFNTITFSIKTAFINIKRASHNILLNDRQLFIFGGYNGDNSNRLALDNYEVGTIYVDCQDEDFIGEFKSDLIIRQKNVFISICSTDADGFFALCDLGPFSFAAGETTKTNGGISTNRMFSFLGNGDFDIKDFTLQCTFNVLTGTFKFFLEYWGGIFEAIKIRDEESIWCPKGNLRLSQITRPYLLTEPHGSLSILSDIEEDGCLLDGHKKGVFVDKSLELDGRLEVINFVLDGDIPGVAFITLRELDTAIINFQIGFDFTEAERLLMDIDDNTHEKCPL